MPVNFMIVVSLRRYDRFYGDTLTVESPVGSGRHMTLAAVADELSARLTRLFLRDANGRRPTFGDNAIQQTDPHFRDNVLFYEHFHGDTGRGLGASHQTGWTGLVALLLHPRGEIDPAAP